MDHQSTPFMRRLQLDDEPSTAWETNPSRDGRSRRSVSGQHQNDSNSVNLSLTLMPGENTYLQDVNYTRLRDLGMTGQSLAFYPGENTYLHNINSSRVPNCNQSLFRSEIVTTSVTRAKESLNEAFDVLGLEFCEILQSQSELQNILETVSQFGMTCMHALSHVEQLKSKVAIDYRDPEEVWLEKERNTWKLIFILYQDRLGTELLKEQQSEPIQYFGLSEKLCVESLFKRDSLVRECQLVIDWLENVAKLTVEEASQFTDFSHGWENTLHQLQSEDTIAFASSREIVKMLHPDAPIYENRSLHDLDQADDKRLCRRIFYEIRRGNLEQAQEICVKCGHGWKAAQLEGWRLYHDPSRESETPEDSESVGDEEPYETEGNERRDLWKQTAFNYCRESRLDRHMRSVMAVYSGYLKEILPVCCTWEDYLWAYMKVMIDVRVESEIRDCVSRCYKDLPDFYWNQRMSLSEVFDQLESSDNKTVRGQSRKPEHIIQKYLILDNIPQLFSELEDFLREDASIHFLRFLTHFILFLDQIGQSPNPNVFTNILETYIKRLMNLNDTQLVAFYISKLRKQKQIDLYSQYLEGITDNEDRKVALKYAEDCDLDVRAIARTVVENIREKPFDIADLTLQEKLTPSDEYKISAIDWLLFYDTDRLEAIVQSNALINKFLTLKKIDAAQLVFNKIPQDTSEIIMSETASTETEKILKEHHSYRSYLDAQEAFSLWFKHFQIKPIEPANLDDNAHLTEKVAHQHRVSQYKAELERWKITMSHLAKSAKTLLYNILLFPDGGWLAEANNSGYLRSTCIPECVILLYTVLFQSGFLSECMKLADVLASERYGLYKVYEKEKLQEIVRKFAEASVALLNAKMDQWGNDANI